MVMWSLWVSISIYLLAMWSGRDDRSVGDRGNQRSGDVACPTQRHSAIGGGEPCVSSSGALRILFAFDPARRAVLLVGGNKAEGSQWNDWYRTAIPRAERLFQEHLKRVENEL